MASAKPVFVFVPGGWHSPDVFDDVTKVLSSKGYTSRGVHLASVGHIPPIENFDADVENVRGVVEDVLSSAQDVVLVVHSYGGLPASEAMKYFMDDDNKDMKGKGRILRIVWVCAFVGAIGDSLHGSIGGKDREWFRVSDGIVNCSEPKRIFYNDMSDAEAEPHINSLQPHAYLTFFSKLSVEPWMRIPSTYVICENDQAIPAYAQERMIAMAQAKSSMAFDVVERCTSGHSPMLTIPRELAGYILKAASSV
ncbi:prolyl aminopeptidase-like protein [Xylogone sp. PMI_703]|nr:prolyl aminopeptidase-like protein [Xylogone sp. PMI_703]